MTLQYDVSEAEIILANQELALTPDGKRLWRRFRRFRMVVGGVVGALIWLILSLRLTISLAFFPLYVLGFMALFGMGLDSVLRRRDIRVAIRRMVQENKGKGVIGQRRLTLAPEGMTVVSDTGSQTVFWSALEKALETPGFLLLQKTEGDYVLLPKHAFTSPQHQAEFLATVERFRLGQVQAASELQKQAWYQSRDQVEK